MATSEQLDAWNYTDDSGVIEPPLNENEVDALVRHDIAPDSELHHPTRGVRMAREVFIICGSAFRIAGPEIVAKELARFRE